jgi:DNA-binding beta-propeller fold protein YncE
MARVRAPELLGQGGWIGAVDNFGLASLSGKIVVLDFFTSSCINCIRVLRELRTIEEQFPNEVAVVGVHSPKFPREHEHVAVEYAVERLGITHPVLDDPDLATWQQYGVKGWPTLVVIDPEGYVVGGISGEGSGPVITSTIEQVIAEYDPRHTIDRNPIVGTWRPSPLAGGFRSLSFPSAVAVDAAGRRIAVADTGNDRVVVADLQGRVEQIYPLLTKPQGVAFDGSRLVVCDTGADRVVAIDRASGQQTELTTTLASPADVAVERDGALVITESGRHRIWRLSPGTEPTTLAGTGQESLVDTSPDQPAVLAQPTGIATLPDGRLVFLDSESSALRVLDPYGRVTTLVGQGVWDWGASDGDRNTAAMQHPMGVATGPSGVVYIADTYNNLLRAWDGNGLRTLPAGDLDGPSGVAVLPDGRLVVADSNNHRVVLVDVDKAEVTALRLDETWLGTGTADAITAAAGASVALPYAVDLGRFSLDESTGPAVTVEIAAEPPGLLAPGPRSWALLAPSGEITVDVAGDEDGLLVVTVDVSVRDGDQTTILRERTRHDVTLTDEGLTDEGVTT